MCVRPPPVIIPVVYEPVGVAVAVLSLDGRPELSDHVIAALPVCRLLPSSGSESVFHEEMLEMVSKLMRPHPRPDPDAVVGAMHW